VHPLALWALTLHQRHFYLSFLLFTFFPTLNLSNSSKFPAAVFNTKEKAVACVEILKEGNFFIGRQQKGDCIIVVVVVVLASAVVEW
jgi:hypothetical protein